MRAAHPDYGRNAPVGDAALAWLRAWSTHRPVLACYSVQPLLHSQAGTAS